MDAKALIQLVHEQKPRFTELDKANGHLLDFTQECLFARQQLLKNRYTLEVAAVNPNSLQAAILSIAAIGISLNPANQHAYLVPRDGAICLDISFQGLKKLATDSGAILWAKVELVYENDTFKWRGPAEAPMHEADPFDGRGAMKGGYCLAKLPDGTILTEVMPVAEINKIRDTSKAFQKKSGPWVNYYEEMAKKTIIKRAYKSWPQTGDRRRLDSAVESLHQSEGTRYTIDHQARYMEALEGGKALEFFCLREEVGTDTWCALFNSFPKGEKTRQKQVSRELEAKGEQIISEYRDALTQACEGDDHGAAQEILEELDTHELGVVLGTLNSTTLEWVNKMRNAE